MGIDLRNVIKERFASKKVVVVGDAVADQFVRGNIDRVSREAPVFILKHEETETVGGGAANTACNVASLGAKSGLVAVVGNDSNGEKLIEALRKSKVDTRSVVSYDAFQTTTKVRILAGQRYALRQQVIRVDYLNEEAEFSSEFLDDLSQECEEAISNADAVILSDYGYGIADALFEKVLSRSNQIPVLIDSRYRLTDFKGAHAATPNKEEIERITGSDFSKASVSRVREMLEVEHLLVTLGNMGMHFFDEESDIHIPVIGSDRPIDVTGAGDTVIATFALGLASGLEGIVAAQVANHAGGLVVMKQGTATVTAEELIESISTHQPELFSA